MDFEVGQVVWAKSGRDPYWPSLISEVKTKEKRYFVIYLAENCKGWVRHMNVCSYSENLEKFKDTPQKNSKTIQEAILIADSIDQANDYLEHEKYQEAIDVLLKVKPKVIYQKKILLSNILENIYHEYSKSQMHLHNFDQALELVEQAIQYTMKSNIVEPDIFLTKGEILFNQGEFEKAEKYYQECIKQFNDDLRFRTNLAEVLQKMGQNKRAEKLFKECIEIDPEFEDIYISQGCFYLEEKRYIEAIQSFDKAMEYDPSNLLTLMNKVEALNLLGRYQQAYDIMISIKNNEGCQDMEFYSQFITAMIGLKMYPESIQYVQYLKKTDPTNTQYYNKQLLKIQGLKDDTTTPFKSLSGETKDEFLIQMQNNESYFGDDNEDFPKSKQNTPNDFKEPKMVNLTFQKSTIESQIFHDKDNKQNEGVQSNSREISNIEYDKQSNISNHTEEQFASNELQVYSSNDEKSPLPPKITSSRPTFKKMIMSSSSINQPKSSSSFQSSEIRPQEEQKQSPTTNQSIFWSESSEKAHNQTNQPKEPIEILEGLFDILFPHFPSLIYHIPPLEDNPKYNHEIRKMGVFIQCYKILQGIKYKNPQIQDNLYHKIKLNYKSFIKALKSIIIKVGFSSFRDIRRQRWQRGLVQIGQNIINVMENYEF